MGDIRVNGESTNANQLSVLNTDEQIGRLSGYKAWLVARDGFMTTSLSGSDTIVSQFQDYRGGAAVFNTSQVSPNFAKRVTGAIGGFEAVQVPNGAAFNRYNGSGFTFDWQQSWTIFGVAQADAAMATTIGSLMGIGGSGDNTRVFVGSSGAGVVQVSIGSSGGTINLPLDEDPFWFIASFYRDPVTSANSKLSFEVNGTRGTDVTRSPIAAMTTLPTCMSYGNSQGWLGKVREMLFLQDSVHFGTGAAAKRELLRKHAQQIYGLGS